MDDAGNFVIVWASDAGAATIGESSRNASMPPAWLREPNSTSIPILNKEQLGPSVAMDSSGDFVVAWSSKDQDGDNWGIFAQAL